MNHVKLTCKVETELSDESVQSIFSILKKQGAKDIIVEEKPE